MRSWKLPPRGKKWRKHLSEALKAKWRSGTRKPMPPEALKKIHAKLREGYASGRLKRPVLSPEIRAKIGRKVSRKHKGKILRKTPMSDSEKEILRQRCINQAGPGHPREKWWKIRSPDNQIFIFKNLQYFIRTHSELFLPEDLAIHASKGIQSICPRKKINVGSWKGWTWYSHLEHHVNEGRDLLDRIPR
jgi:hypothetical protein